MFENLKKKTIRISIFFKTQNFFSGYPNFFFTLEDIRVLRVKKNTNNSK